MQTSLASIVKTQLMITAAFGAALTGCSKSPQDAAKQRQGAEPAATSASVPSASVQAQLTKLRDVGARSGWTFETGDNPAMHRPLEQLAGTRIDPADFERVAPTRNAYSVQALEILRGSFAAQNVRLAGTGCAVTSQLCNLQPKMTPVRSQGSCGSCWDFAAMGAWEGSYNVLYGGAPDTSEQQVLTCSNAGTCSGGWWDPVYQWMIGTGVGTEAQTPYTGRDGPCVTHPPGTARVAAWGFVTTKWQQPTVAQIKQAMAAHGPLVVAVRATPAFQAYKSGIFNENAAGTVNHGVVLVGWDDTRQAWRLRNSWDSGWGEQGYMWIRYGSNSVGYAATWVTPVTPRFAKVIDVRLKPVFNRFTPQ